MEIIECEQGSPEWFKHRLGSIGGSSISSVMAKGQGKMRKNLMYRLAGEILSGQNYEGYSNAHMERGLELEDEARNVYSAVSGNEVRQVGLAVRDKYRHYSPDGLINNGIIEVKCTIPSVHIDIIIQNEIPPEYRKQCQWGLSICEVEEIDFISYSPTVIDKPIWIISRPKDQKLIKEMHEEASKFLFEMAMLIKKVKEA